MPRPRWNKVTSDLWSNKIRSLLVIASITVGLFAVGLITSMYVIITEDLKTGYASVNPANIQIITNAFDTDLVDHIRSVPGVRQAEGARTITLRVRSADGDWKPIEIKAIPDIAGMQIDQVNLEQGVWPPKDREMVVDHYKLGDLPSGVGGMIEVELPSGKVRQIPLVGVVNDQTIGSSGGGGFFLAPAQGYVTLDTLDWLEYPDTMNHLYVTATGDSNDEQYLREVSNRVSSEIESTGRVVSNSVVRATDDHPNRVYVQAISSVLFVLGFLVMFLSAFLITNTLSALLGQQEHQIGVMKTIGARRGQIISIYMVLIFIFGLTAFVISLPSLQPGSIYLAGVLCQGDQHAAPGLPARAAGSGRAVDHRLDRAPGSRLHSDLAWNEYLRGRGAERIQPGAPTAKSWFDRRLAEARARLITAYPDLPAQHIQA